MAPDPQDALFDTRRTLHLSFADQGTCKTARSKITRSLGCIICTNAVVLWRFLYFKLLANSSVLSSGGDPRELLSVSKNLAVACLR